MIFGRAVHSLADALRALQLGGLDRLDAQLLLLLHVLGKALCAAQLAACWPGTACATGYSAPRIEATAWCPVRGGATCAGDLNRAWPLYAL
jgi:hypothetical protein